MPSRTMQELFVDELKDLYSAEKQLIEALPKMAKAASAPELKKAFKEHLAETKEHAARLKKIFKQLREDPEGETCEAMEGLVEEGGEVIDSDDEAAVKDAALIAAAQRVEHYEIAGYGTVRTFAERLGHDDIAKVLQTTLDEEGAADKKLTEIAESSVNEEAAATA